MAASPVNLCSVTEAEPFFFFFLSPEEVQGTTVGLEGSETQYLMGGRTGAKFRPSLGVQALVSLFVVQKSNGLGRGD